LKDLDNSFRGVDDRRGEE